MAEPPKVNFIIAGVQKAGTTALYDYLAEMGDVVLSREKEAHFFDDDSLDWSQPDYGAYHALFADPDGGPCGEATPIYLYWPNCLERIAAYNPEMKLIVLLRDPVERAWSQWRMEHVRKHDNMPFSWCIREGRMRLFEAEPWGFHRQFSYVERGFYGDQMERLFSLFPRPQVLVLRAEDLREEQPSTLAAVRRFLGLPKARRLPEPRTVFAGPDLGDADRLSEEDAAFLGRLYARDQARLAAVLAG